MKRSDLAEPEKIRNIGQPRMPGIINQKKFIFDGKHTRADPLASLIVYLIYQYDRSLFCGFEAVLGAAVAVMFSMAKAKKLRISIINQAATSYAKKNVDAKTACHRARRLLA